MALAEEIGEPREMFQWLTPEHAVAVMDGDREGDVEDELADAVIYRVRLADVLDIDLVAAATARLASNETRFPAAPGWSRAGSSGCVDGHVGTAPGPVGRAVDSPPR